MPTYFHKEKPKFVTELKRVLQVVGDLKQLVINKTFKHFSEEIRCMCEGWRWTLGVLSDWKNVCYVFQITRFFLQRKHGASFVLRALCCTST